MYSKLLKTILTCIAICIVQNVISQEALNEVDFKKIANADKKLKKADAVVSKADKYTTQVENLKNDGSVRVRKIQKLETKANKIIIKSSSYYKDGYGKKYKTYEGVVKREIKSGGLNEGAVSKGEVARDLYKIGRKWRRKSNGQSNVDKGVEYLYKANEEEGKAIEKLVGILESVQVVEEVEEVAVAVDTVQQPTDTVAQVLPVPVVAELVVDSIPNVVQDSIAFVSQDTLSVIPEIQDTLYFAEKDTLNEASIVETPEVAGMETTTPVEISSPVEEMLEEEPIEEPAEENFSTYFTVQFLADKNPVPKEKIASLYGGSHEIIKHEGEGWFRYSFGKFADIDKAKQALSESGANGYVVAYHNDVRISTRKALELMAEE